MKLTAERKLQAKGLANLEGDQLKLPNLKNSIVLGKVWAESQWPKQPNVYN